MNRFYLYIKGVLASLFLFVLSGCETIEAPVSMSMDSISSKSLPRLGGVEGEFSAYLNIIKDDRPNKEHIGGHYEHHAPDNLSGWVKEGFLMLNENGVELVSISDEGTELDERPRLDVSIKRCYIRAATSSEVAVVVVRIRLQKDGAVYWEKVCRGQSVSVNWFGSREESKSAFNQALRNLLLDVRESLIDSLEES